VNASYTVKAKWLDHCKLPLAQSNSVQLIPLMGIYEGTVTADAESTLTNHGFRLILHNWSCRSWGCLLLKGKSAPVWTILEMLNRSKMWGNVSPETCQSIDFTFLLLNVTRGEYSDELTLNNCSCPCRSWGCLLLKGKSTPVWTIFGNVESFKDVRERVSRNLSLHRFHILLLNATRARGEHFDELTLNNCSCPCRREAACF